VDIREELLVDLKFLELVVGTPESAMSVPPVAFTGGWCLVVGSLFHEVTVGYFPEPEASLPGLHVFDIVDLPQASGEAQQLLPGFGLWMQG
jgi:hypothetical protein